MTGFTVLFASIVAIISVVIGYLIALAIRAVPSRRQPLILLSIFVPKTAGVVTTMFGLQRLLSETGLINAALVGSGLLKTPLSLSRNGFGAILAESYLIIPVVTLMLHLQLSRVDENLEFASRGLGAGRWQSFCRITLPLSVPGLRLSFQLSLMWGLAAFLGPMFLGSPDETTLAVEAYRQAFEYSRWPRAASLAMLSLLLISGVACWAAAHRWRAEGRR
jgi:ABC-type spermidine/putrescine transport system permease subunit I